MCLVLKGCWRIVHPSLNLSCCLTDKLLKQYDGKHRIETTTISVSLDSIYVKVQIFRRNLKLYKVNYHNISNNQASVVFAGACVTQPPSLSLHVDSPPGLWVGDVIAPDIQPTPARPALMGECLTRWSLRACPCAHDDTWHVHAGQTGILRTPKVTMKDVDICRQ